MTNSENMDEIDKPRSAPGTGSPEVSGSPDAAGKGLSFDHNGLVSTVLAENSAVPDGEGADEPTSLLSWRLLACIVVVLVVLGVVANTVIGGSHRSSIGPTAAKAVNAAVSDDFSGTDAFSLGTTTTGQSWDQPLGVWGKANGVAYLVTPNPKGAGRSIAVTDLKSANGSVSAKAVNMVAGWGIVFRYSSIFDYWLITASPQFGSIAVLQVSQGETKVVGKALGTLENNTLVAVTFEGANITISIDGKQSLGLVATNFDASAFGGTKVGLVADRQSPDAKWSDFVAMRLGPAGPVVATPKPPATPSTPTTVPPTTSTTKERVSK